MKSLSNCAIDSKAIVVYGKIRIFECRYTTSASTKIQLDFSLSPLYKKALKENIRASVSFDRFAMTCTLAPLTKGNKLYARKRKNIISIDISKFLSVKDKEWLLHRFYSKEKSKVVSFPVGVMVPTSFGISRLESIVDQDAMNLAAELAKRGWTIPSERLTTREGHGDLLMIAPNGTKCLFEISRWQFSPSSYSKNREATFLLGKLAKCLLYAKRKKIRNVFLIFKTRSTLPLLEKLSIQLGDIFGVQVKLLKCNFEERWGQKISEVLSKTYSHANNLRVKKP